MVESSKNSRTDNMLKKPNPERISIAIQKLASAASGHVGRDCLLHAVLAQKALKELEGVDTRLIIGFAGWRVGEGDSDVVLHAPMPGMVYQGEDALPYHAWLATKDYLIDLSTYQLRDKARQIDALDGGSTQVDWCPDFLVVKHKKISTLKQVAQLTAGTFFYLYNAQMDRKLKETSREIDPEDWANFLLIYHNPDITVFGPNHFP